MIQFNLKKINCCPKKEKKNNSSRGKNPDLPPPPDIKFPVRYNGPIMILRASVAKD